MVEALHCMEPHHLRLVRFGRFDFLHFGRVYPPLLSDLATAAQTRCLELRPLPTDRRRKASPSQMLMSLGNTGGGNQKLCWPPGIER
jgi:hypothetical protein